MNIKRPGSQVPQVSVHHLFPLSVSLSEKHFLSNVHLQFVKELRTNDAYNSHRLSEVTNLPTVLVLTDFSTPE